MESKYNLTLEQYEELSISQRHRCKVCGTHRTKCTHGKLVIDHCHKTGKVRGLLCDRCNQALGLIGENIAILGRMVKYIKETRQAISGEWEP